MVQLWNISTGCELVSEYQAHDNFVWWVSYGNNIVCTGCNDGSFCVLELDENMKFNLKHRVVGHENCNIWVVDHSIQKNRIVTADGHGNIKLWNLETAELIAALRYKGGIYDLCICDDFFIATSSMGFTGIASLEDGRLLRLINFFLLIN